MDDYLEHSYTSQLGLGVSSDHTRAALRDSRIYHLILNTKFCFGRALSSVYAPSVS